jgi:hypothetical protein
LRDLASSGSVYKTGCCSLGLRFWDCVVVVEGSIRVVEGLDSWSFVVRIEEGSVGKLFGV